MVTFYSIKNAPIIKNALRTEYALGRRYNMPVCGRARDSIPPYTHIGAHSAISIEKILCAIYLKVEYSTDNIDENLSDNDVFLQ